jgi:hypothetical protein
VKTMVSLVQPFEIGFQTVLCTFEVKTVLMSAFDVNAVLMSASMYLLSNQTLT